MKVLTLSLIVVLIGCSKKDDVTPPKDDLQYYCTIAAGKPPFNLSPDKLYYASLAWNKWNVGKPGTAIIQFKIRRDGKVTIPVTMNIKWTDPHTNSIYNYSNEQWLETDSVYDKHVVVKYE